MPRAGGIGADGGQRRELGLVGGDDQLAAAGVRHAALGAVAIEELLAGNAEPRLEAALGIVDAGMDHLAVARAGLGADGVRTLQDDHLEPGHGQPARAGEAHHTGPDHDAVDPLHRELAAERPVEFGLADAQAGDGRQDVGQALVVDRHALGQALLPGTPLGLARQQDLG